MITPDILIRDAVQVVTVAGQGRRPKVGEDMAELDIIAGGFVAVQGDRIALVGKLAELESTVRIGPDTQVISAAGKTVLPGLVDPHTHASYAGSRASEFALRLQGATYREIMEAGGGIMNTVRATRGASLSELAEESRARLDRMLAWGTTTIEVKSGYGLTTPDEIKMLRVVAELGRDFPGLLVPTFLGAHEIPPEYRPRRKTYVDLICDEMIPLVAEKGLARFCDVFCEDGVFTVAESRRVLEAGRKAGLAAKIHADELTTFGGAELAAEVEAVSADHLLCASNEGLQDMAKAGVVAVLLPGTPFFLMMKQYAPARRMIELGLPIALATDSNPGSCPIEALPIAMSLACLQMKLTPAEAISAATINAAHALGLGDEVGSLEPGKRADVAIFDAPSYEEIVYRFGVNLAGTVIAGGKIVISGGKALTAGGKTVINGREVEQ